MADAFYVSIVGRNQGNFAADDDQGKFRSKIKGLAFHYEVTSPRDSVTGQASGRRQHSPVTFVKEWGASSPQLVKAALTNELLTSVLFEFIATNELGEEQIVHTIKLTNASVASVKQDAKGTPGGQGLQDLEEVSIVFQDMEMENLPGQTVAVDAWGGKGGKGSRLEASGIEVAEIAVQEPYAGLTDQTEAAAGKLATPRTLISRAPSG